MPMPGAVVLRSDVERKAMFGVAETAPLPESAYAAAASAKIYATLAAKARRVVAAGHSAIVDAVFAQPDERADIARASDSVDFSGVFLTADLQSRLERVGSRTGDASDATAAIVQDQEKFELGRIIWANVDASGTPEETFIRAKVALRLE
jgi:predicted kinase